MVAREDRQHGHRDGRHRDGDQRGSATDGTDTDSSETSQTEDTASASTLPPVPGLYGNQYELQVDVSRLPRVDRCSG